MNGAGQNNSELRFLKWAMMLAIVGGWYLMMH